MKAVIAPAGISAGAMTTRPIASQTPAALRRDRNAHGISTRWSALTRVRTRCGTTRPTNPIGPVKRDRRRCQERAGAIAESASACETRAPRVAAQDSPTAIRFHDARLAHDDERRPAATVAMKMRQRRVVDRVEAADQPARDRERLRYACQPVHQHDERGADAVGGDAGEQQAERRRSAGRGSRRRRRARGPARRRPARRPRRRARRRRRCQPSADRDHGAQRRAGRDAERVRRRQRVAQHRLEQRARQRQRPAGEQTEQRSRDAQLHEDRPVRLFTLPRAARSRAGRADERQQQRCADECDRRTPPIHRRVCATLASPARVAWPTDDTGGVGANATCASRAGLVTGGRPMGVRPACA